MQSSRQCSLLNLISLNVLNIKEYWIGQNSLARGSASGVHPGCLGFESPTGTDYRDLRFPVIFLMSFRRMLG